MKRISIAVLIFLVFAVRHSKAQEDAQELVAPTVRWDDPKVRDNAAFRELKRRVLSGVRLDFSRVRGFCVAQDSPSSTPALKT